MIKQLLLRLGIVMSLMSCNEAAKPKPRGYLALTYPKPQYDKITSNCPFSFQVNRLTNVKPAKSGQPCWLDISYPNMKGTIYITYQPVQNKQHLMQLIRDGQNLPLEHTIKADKIDLSTYTNDEHNTYGNFYEVKGDAASQAQFYLTDSTQHFLTGSIYFKAKPNFDSIIPAANYLQKDIQHLMETVRWK